MSGGNNEPGLRLYHEVYAVTLIGEWFESKYSLSTDQQLNPVSGKDTTLQEMSTLERFATEKSHTGCCNSLIGLACISYQRD